jgi:hypothetical protein
VEDQQNYRDSLATAHALIKHGNGVDAWRQLEKWRSFPQNEPELLEAMYQTFLLWTPGQQGTIFSHSWYESAYSEAIRDRRYSDIPTSIRLKCMFSSIPSFPLTKGWDVNLDDYFNIPEAAEWNLSQKYVLDLTPVKRHKRTELLQRNLTVVMCGMYRSNPYIVLALTHKQMVKTAYGIEKTGFEEDQVLTLLRGRAFEALGDKPSAIKNYAIATKGSDTDFAKEAREAIVRLQQ